LPVTFAAQKPAPNRIVVQAVVFDFGGTLDGDGLHWSTRFRRAYARAGLSVPLEAFERAFAEADRRIARDARFASEGLAALVAAQVREQMDLLGLSEPALARAIAADALAEATACLGDSRALLRLLRPHVRLAVVSNYTGALERVCREAGLLPLLDVVVDSVRVGVAKPDPEIFRVAVRRLGLPAAECLAVGDSVDRDVLPAKAAGLRAVWLRGRDPRRSPGQDAADAIVESLGRLPGLLGLAA
jgi:HAD superfamily hydrolase (TIGR01509 family)